MDKPAGLVVHPVNTVRDNSLIRMLRRQEGSSELRLAHRLIARRPACSSAPSMPRPRASLRPRSSAVACIKEYVAVVRGDVEGDEGTIDMPIGEGDRSRVFVRREVTADGERAVTRWRLERRLDGATLLRLFPETGRRHQLRVHLAAVGHTDPGRHSVRTARRRLPRPGEGNARTRAGRKAGPGGILALRAARLPESDGEWDRRGALSCRPTSTRSLRRVTAASPLDRSSGSCRGTLRRCAFMRRCSTMTARCSTTRGCLHEAGRSRSSSTTTGTGRSTRAPTSTAR